MTPRESQPSDAERERVSRIPNPLRAAFAASAAFEALILKKYGVHVKCTPPIGEPLSPQQVLAQAIAEVEKEQDQC